MSEDRNGSTVLNFKHYLVLQFLHIYGVRRSSHRGGLLDPQRRGLS